MISIESSALKKRKDNIAKRAMIGLLLLILKTVIIVVIIIFMVVLAARYTSIRDYVSRVEIAENGK